MSVYTFARWLIMVGVLIMVVGVIAGIAKGSPDPAPGAKHKITYVAYDYSYNPLPWLRADCHVSIHGTRRCTLHYLWGQR